MAAKERHLAQGIVSYTTAYIVFILLAVCAMTGRLVFLLFIVLTLGLQAYLVYRVTVDVGHFEKAGELVEKTLKSLYATFSGGGPAAAAAPAGGNII